MSKKFISTFAFVLAFTLAMAFALVSPAYAGGNVGTCDEASLDAALAGGGTVTFSCSGTIVVTTQKSITTSTTIDAGMQAVVLSGGDTNGIFTISANPNVVFTLKNLTLQEGRAGAGGAVYANQTGTILNIEDSQFISNTGTTNGSTGGGALFLWPGSANITNTTFIRNHSNDHGGAIFMRGSGSLHLNNVNFYSNTNVTSNGAINMDGDLKATGGVVRGHVGPSGAFSAASIEVDNVTFRNNAAPAWYGGALFASVITVTNSDFISNTAVLGGAIFGNTSIWITNGSAFSNNAATSNGGAIYNDSGDTTVSNTSFISNTATYGGGIYSLGPLTVTAASAFTGNDAAAHGGAIYVKDSGAPLNVSDSRFESNKSDSNLAGPGAGGAIYAEGSGSLVTISNSDFLSNTNRIDDNFGGAVAVYNGPTLSISDSTFKWNSGNVGGAVGVWDSSATIFNTQFYTNSASNTGFESRGGALSQKGSGTIAVSGSHFAGNTAENKGGAFYSERTSAVEQSSFVANTITGAAEDDGGGAMYNNTVNGIMNVTNSTFSDNSSASDSGAIETNGTLHLLNTTIVYNTAVDNGGGIGIGGGSVYITNTIVAINTGPNGADVAGTFTAAINNLLSNTEGGITDGVNGNIVSATPGLDALTSAGNGTMVHPLQVGSPAVNAADDASAPTTDQRGVARPQGAQSDIGAYEAAVSTTGPGGVTTGMTLWLKANAGAGVNDGDAVSAWTDQSVNGHDATQSVAANQPSFESDGTKQINFNPVVHFENAASTEDKLLITGTAYASRDVMFVMRGNTTGFQTIYDNQQPGSGINDPDENDGISVTGNALDTSAMAWNYNTGSNGTVAGVYYVNGQQTPSITPDTPLLVTVDKPQAETFTYMLNSNDGGFSYWQGDIAEFVVYANDVSPADRNKVESYLALKYGITLTGTQGISYTLSDGTTVWDADANAAYHNDVAGIGRDDASVLHQPRSQSINSGAILQVYHDANGGNISNDLTSYIWGHNGGDANFGVTVGDKIHMNRVWKVQDTGNYGGLVHIIPDTTGAEVMWVDTDADCDFSTGAPSETTLTSGGGVLTATVNVGDGRCFTFAKSAATTALTLSKTAEDVNGAPLQVGDEILYTVVVTNLLGGAQAGVVITDTIPANTTYVAASAQTSQGSVNGPDPLVANIGTLSGSAVATFTFRVMVDAGAAGQTIQNTAQADSPTQSPFIEVGPIEPSGGGLVIDTDPPTEPVLISPSGNITDTDQPITFEWNPSTDAGSPITYTLTVTGPNGVVISIETTSTTYIPSTDLPPGDYTWTVVATDPSGNSSTPGSGSFTIIDTTPPTEPVLINPPLPPSTGTLILETEQPITYTWQPSTDNSGGPITYTLTVTGPNGVVISIETTSTTYIPSTDLPPGDYTWTVVATDPSGNSSTPGSGSFTIEAVGTVDLPPTISDILNQLGFINTPITVTFTISDDITPVDSLGLVAASSNTTLIPVGNIAFAGSGTDRWVVITPTTGLTGTSLITLTVDDGGLSAYSAFFLGIDDNVPPNAVDDNAWTPEGIAVTVSVLDNDFDANGDALSIVSAGAAGNGVTSVNSNTVIYTPTAGFIGADSFVYTITDGEFQDSAVVTVDVLPVADLSVSQSFTRSFNAITFTLVARNLGPLRPANGAVISDTFPSELTNVSWSCVASGGASCTASGAGNAFSDTLTAFPAGGVATYTVRAGMGLLDQINNTVVITTPVGTVDLNQSNNRVTLFTGYRLTFPIIFKS